VAVAIFTVVGILAMSGYNQLSRHGEIAAERMARVRAVQTAMLKLTQDFAQLEPRPVREPLGSNLQPALRADPRTGAVVQLTRAGWPNPAGIGRSTLQRVEYRWENDVLYRDQHGALDAVLDAEPLRLKLLDKVRAIRFEYLDVQQQWSKEWPRVGAPPGSRGRPLAVKIELELEDWGTITRIVEVSNAAVN